MESEHAAAGYIGQCRYCDASVWADDIYIYVGFEEDELTHVGCHVMAHEERMAQDREHREKGESDG